MRKGRLYSIILCNCNYVTICSAFVLYEIKMENKKKKGFKGCFFVILGIFCLELGKKHTFWHWEWGRIPAPKSGDREP